MPAVKLLVAMDGRPAGAILHTDRVTTEVLVSSGKATYDLTGGAEFPRERETVCFGPYDTVAELTTAYPPLLYAGCLALVGATAPYARYLCDGVAWVAAVVAGIDPLTGGSVISAGGKLVSGIGADAALGYGTSTLIANGTTLECGGVAEYKFDGNLNDSSGNANHAALTSGSPAYLDF